MSDVNANINISIDSSQALAQLRNLQNQISAFNKSVVAGNSAAAAAQRDLNRNLAAQINATKQFTTSMTTVESSVGRLGRSIDKGKLSLGEYFRYGTAASGMFGKAMKENAEIMALAESRAKRLQTQYVALGNAQNGYTKAMAIRPNNLFNADAAISIQRQQIFNKLLNDGSTSLINWGKNTQWAGRQLMVGFTVPLTIFGGVAAQTFMDLEKQIVQFKRVYGDLGTMKSETDAMVGEIQRLGAEFTKYGISVSDTIALAADAAAAGYEGADLIAQTTEATRLATLGQIDYQQALDATITLQSAFGTSAEDMAQSTNFLNAVENQTVLSLDDVTQSIPIVATVIKGLGGDVKDLAVLLTAMREGGVSANEGANALKTSLARLITPTKAASERAKEFGINLKAIVDTNQGNLMGMIMDLEQAMRGLSNLEKQKFLSDLFGKRQFARMGALFGNIAKEGSQAQRVLDLTAMSAEDLGQIADGELSKLEEAVGVKFTGAVEKLKLAIAPIGEAFLKIATPIIEFATKVADKFNSLPDAAKTFITWAAAIGGVLVPTVVMLVGLIGNFAGNILKIGLAFGRILGKTQGFGHSLDYLTEAELDAMAASASLEGQTNGLTSALNTQRGAVVGLARSYGRYVAAAQSAAANIPQGFRGRPAGYARGGVVPGSGNGDTVPALLTPGESVITKEATQKYGPIIEAMNAGTLPGFAQGVVNLGGQSITREFFNASSIQAIERMFDSIPEMAADLRTEFIQILRNVGDTEKLTAGMLRDIISESGSQGLSRAVGPRETRYSAPSGLGSVGEQLLAERGEAARIEIERAQGSAQAAAEAMREYGATQGQIADAQQISRSHMIELQQGDKAFLEAWHSDAWEATSQAENQLSNLVAGNERNHQIYQQYLDNLSDDVANEETKRVLMDKVSKNLALTEEEYQIQAQLLRNMLADLKSGRLSADAVTAALPAYAAGTIGAAEWRASAGAGYAGRSRGELSAAEARMMAARAGGEVNNVLQINSPSEVGAESGDELDRGVALGIERSSKIPVNAVHDMANEVKGQLAMDFEDDGLFPADPYRDPRGPQYKPTPTPIAKPKTMGDFGVTQAPLSVRRDFFASTEKASTEIKNTAKESGIVAKGLKKFGGSLKNGSMKLTGAMFALDGLVFGLSMMDNGIGEMAQKIMPVVFGLQSLQMILPMLMNPWGAMIAAVVAVGAGLWFLNKTTSDLKDKAKDLSKAMVGATANIKDTAEFFGNQSFSDKAASIGARTEGVTQEDLTQAQEYMTTEAGTKLVEDLRMVLDSLGSKEAAKALQNNLQRLILSGAVTPEQAKALASELGKQLGNTQIGVDARLHLNEMIGPDGKITSFDERIKIVGDIIADTASLDDAFKRAGILWDQSGWWTQVTMIVKGEGTADLFAQGAASETVAALQVIQTEMDRLNTLLDSGTITVDKYQENMAKLIEQRKNLTYANAKDKASFKLGEDFDQGVQDSLAQGFADALINSSMNGLGAEAGKRFIEGFNTEVSRIDKETGGLTSRKINILDPQDVRTEIEEMDKQIAKSEDKLNEFLLDAQDNYSNMTEAEKQQSAQQEYDMQKRISDLQSAKEKLLELQDASLTLGTKLESGIVSMPTLQKLLDNNMEPVDIALLLDAQYDSPEAEAVVMAALNLAEDGAETDFVVNVLANMNGQQLEQRGGEMLSILNLPSEVSMPLTMKWANMTPDQVMVDMARMDGAVQNFSADLENMDTKKEVKLFMKDEFSQIVDRFNMDWKWIAGLDPLQKYVYFNYITTYIKRYQTAGGGTVSPNQVEGWGGDTFGPPVGALPDKEPPEDPPPDPDPTPEKPGGSSEKKVSKMREFLNGLLDQIKLYGNINATYKQLIGKRKEFLKLFEVGKGVTDKLRAAGYSEAFIAEIVSQGAGFAKRFAENNIQYGKKGRVLGKTKTGKRREALSTQAATLSASEELRASIETESNRGTAAQILAQRGVAKNVIDELVKDDNVANLIANQAALGKKGKKALDEYINRLIKLDGITKDADTSKLRDEIDALTKSFEESIKAVDKDIEKKEKEIELIQEQIDSLEKLNDKDQDSIDSVERSIEMINRDIAAKERLNELDQRRVETLRRQDEIRMRESDALSHELEMMGRVEEKIRESYQERIDALNETKRINDHLINQQKTQLDMSKALSEGDVYAAAAAAQAMQEESVNFASEQTTAALEKGMQNAISGLTTSTGMTREQAQERMNALQDQSYQTGLLIRDIEDSIYQRNLEIVPLKDAIFNKEAEVLVIKDRIYERDQQIKTITDDRLEKEKLELEKLQDKRDELKKILDSRVDELQAQIDSMDMTQEQSKRVNKLAQEWAKVAEQINQANKQLNDRKAKLGSAPTPFKGESTEEFKARQAEWETKLKDYEEQYSKDVANAQASVSAFSTGGLLGGSGNRDSLLARLTPGEFVVRKAMVNKYGTGMLGKINQGSFPTYNTGERSATVSGRGSANINAPVYNSYSISVPVTQPNASADEIAYKVMTKIKNIDSASIRRVNGY